VTSPANVHDYDANLAKTELESDLARQMAFQRRWRTLSMCVYVLTTIGTLVCTAGATYFAADGKLSNLAALLAALATFFVGTEKSLLFREK
jgi:hypothetical protein